MHDPMVVVFELHLPVPRLERWRRPNAPRWAIRPHRFTNPENLGEFVYAWWRPKQYKVFLAGRTVRWREFVCVWHNEPNGHDYGHICGRLPSGSDLTWKNVRWAFKHRAHLSYQFGWWQQWCRRRYQRCEHCGGRSTRDHPVNVGGSWDLPKSKWNESVPGLMHMECSSVRHLQHALTEANEALIAAGVTAADLELRCGWQGTKAWRVIYNADRQLAHPESETP